MAETTDVQTPEEKAAEERKEQLERTWRILKFSDEADNGSVTWTEVGQVVKDSRWSRPSAEELGETWGAGEYLLLRAGEEYDIRTVRVIGRTQWDEADDEDEDEEA